MKRALLLLAFVLFLADAVHAASTACLTVELTPQYVKAQIDGDTFSLYAIRVPPEERVRILGINAPERGKPGAAEATAFTKNWLSLGDFTLTACKRDSFGRLLGTVTRGTDDLGKRLMEAGLAVEDIR